MVSSWTQNELGRACMHEERVHIDCRIERNKYMRAVDTEGETEAAIVFVCDLRNIVDMTVLTELYMIVTDKPILNHTFITL